MDIDNFTGFVELHHGRFYQRLTPGEALILAAKLQLNAMEAIAKREAKKAVEDARSR